MCPGSESLTPLVITDKFIASTITSTFADAMLLDSDYKILSVGKDLSVLFGSNDLKLEGENINTLAIEGDVVSRLRELMKQGYFKEQLFHLDLGKKKSVPLGIAGFSVGVASEPKNLTVLRIRSLGEIQQIAQSVTRKAEQLENFIYRSSHDLCGPVATIRGLVNLSRIRKNDAEVDMLFEYISQHAEILNTRLRELERWAEFYDSRSQ